MINSHYVPKLTLRKFSDKLCLFNIQTGEYKENVKLDNAFSELGFYNDEVEDKLNKKIESQFGNLLSNKILLAEGSIELNREELQLIKKFLLVSVIRSMGNEEFMRKEKNFYIDLNELSKKYAEEHGIKEEPIAPPFIEKEIEGETPFDYWMRTLDVILETNGTPQAILEHPNKTYPAHRWSKVINDGYLGFWDSEYEHNEFVITDIGMTSENEKGWNGITQHNFKKTTILMNLAMSAKNDLAKLELYKLLDLHKYFTENFMMFPISAKRMIVEIDPFYKLKLVNRSSYEMLDLSQFTYMTNENLFKPNDTKYVYSQKPFKPLKYHPNDKYIYEIKKLSNDETIYCNELFLDRINTWVGFSSLDKAYESFIKYYESNSYPFVPRVDYTEMYKIINEKYNTGIDLDLIERVRK